MLPVTFHPRLFILLCLGFIASVIIGTLSHECGHYFMARSLGYIGSDIHYGSSYPGHDPEMDAFSELWIRREEATSADLPFDGERRLEDLERRLHRSAFLVTVAGPLQTMLTGTIGLLLILVYRRRFRNAELLSLRQWMLIFLSLFWMRQPVNLVMGICSRLLTGVWGNGDESRLSMAFGWPRETIYMVTGAMGLYILWVVVFNYIPVRQRFTFFLAGFVGGGAGYVLWLHILGPVVLP